MQKPLPWTARARGASYAEAVDHLDRARHDIQSELSTLDTYQQELKFGAVSSVVGISVNAAFKGNLKSVVGFATLGGLSHVGDQNLSSSALATIYDAGLENLSCIDVAGSQVMQSNAPLRDIAARLDTAVATLQADLNVYRVSTVGKADIKTVTDAQDIIDQANNLHYPILKATSETSVADSMVTAVDETILAVNRQVRLKSVSVDDTLKSGSTFSIYENQGLDLKTQIDAATQKAASAGASGAAMANDSAGLGQLTSAEAEVAILLKQANALLATAALNPGNADRCKAQFSAGAPLGIGQSSPVSLAAGGNVEMTPDGTAPYTLTWTDSGAAMPADLDNIVNSPTQKTVHLQAHANAAVKSYTFILADAGGRISAPVTLNVTAAIPPVPAPPPAPPPGQIPVPVAIAADEEHNIVTNILGGQIGADQFLGLPFAVVPGDAVWQARVNDLAKCYEKNPPTNGVLDNNLKSRLDLHPGFNKPIRSGPYTCPAGTVPS